ncbi:response regulator transcription factor [Streptococcus sp. H49]|uniref:response regulator transcription factor n=1 Tax=Streptococcus huangxiaojuni TaxID=3237239 RepID=UPI0034A0E2C2
MKILVAEDEVQIARVLTAALKREGYTVDAVANGQEAVEQAAKNVYDVMVLDIMMPVKTGIEAVKEIRQSGNRSYIIMLTAMAEIDDRVNGLDAGADDYLTKPFSLKELLARVRSLGRRVDTDLGIVSLGRTALNVEEHELSSKNTIRLAGKEAKMLAYFMLNAGKRLSTQQLFSHVWPKDEVSGVDSGYVYIYISYLRQKLQAVGADLAIIAHKGGVFELVEM